MSRNGEVTKESQEQVEANSDTESKIGIKNKQVDGWEEKFDHEFPNMAWADLTLNGLTTRYNATAEIKSFICSLLSLQKEKLRKRIKAKKHTMTHITGSNPPEEDYIFLDDILKIIDEVI